MPGMGLTAIGLAGLTLSYAGIAHTFIDGMHALTGLTMFVGLIFLAAGILDGGVSTSNRAKATTLVILSIALGFGMWGMALNTSNFTVTLAGILMGIAFPAIIISYLYMKHPEVENQSEQLFQWQLLQELSCGYHLEFGQLLTHT